jgi:hypothetical protein
MTSTSHDVIVLVGHRSKIKTFLLKKNLSILNYVQNAVRFSQKFREQSFYTCPGTSAK